jgi:hypothetical protein
MDIKAIINDFTVLGNILLYYYTKLRVVYALDPESENHGYNLKDQYCEDLLRPGWLER